ncbi:thiamine biosynthesis protein ThiF [Moraxella osloensis]|nr:ThiF family adenylyltransferase [Moraxella osloensis]MBW4017120.1 thiamine biosynthesis protein ThiF [Moraxella osloensis]
MQFTEQQLIETLDKLDFIKCFNELVYSENIVTFKVIFKFELLQDELEFEVTIYPQYPFKWDSSETIIFKNKDLIEYSHIMGDGSVCFHNQHATQFETKLIHDFQSIKRWIEKYYINGETDGHYEHLIKNPAPIDNMYYSYQFTDVEHCFSKNEFGTVSLYQLSLSNYRDANITNYIVQSFNSVGLESYPCDWNDFYLQSPSNSYPGIYIFIKDKPVLHNRFLYTKWEQFSEFLPEEFLGFIARYLIEMRGKISDKNPLPLFIGYDIPNNKVHWQVALVDIKSANLFFQPSLDVTGQTCYSLKNQAINWAICDNLSYEYFFGRGRFCDDLVNKKILIIGVGAVGSNVAKTLVRGGCLLIDLADFDTKHPENICRSEYEFTYAYCNKTEELFILLNSISPFVTVGRYHDWFTKLIKNDLSKNEMEIYEEWLAKYDFIFDCSTDDDLMYLLNQLEFNGKVINLSITNHANELVCGISPNNYRFVIHQFGRILKNDAIDMYNPTGCWSPTFKASYNDISTLTQYALKIINGMIDTKTLTSFVIHYDENQNLKLEKF